jgi:hypothetical protein
MDEIKPLDVILHLLDPKSIKIDGKISVLCSDPLLLDESLKLAERNGLYYLALTKLVEFTGDKSLFETQRWHSEMNKLSGYKECLKLLNVMLESREFDYLLIKACTEFPHVPRDVDIFVHSSDVTEIIKYFNTKGLKCSHSDSVDTTLVKGDNMKMDLYTGLCYFTASFFDDEFLWNSRDIDYIFDIGISSLNDEANFMVLLVHSLFGHRSISLLDLLQMGKLLEKPINLNLCRDIASENGWEDAFGLALKEIQNLYSQLYNNNSNIKFPYLFDYEFIMRCISGIDDLNMSKENELFLRLSLIHDKIGFSTKDTIIYNTIKSCGPARSFCNNVGHFIRKRRGDQRSGEK